MRKSSLAAIAASILIGVIANPISALAAELKKVTFLTNFTFNGRHVPFFVGLDKGYYKEAGFDIQILPAAGGGAVIAALSAHKADYGMAESSTVLQAISEGVKVKGFAVYMDGTTSGLASLTPYEDPSSIVHKKVVAGANDSARVTLPIIFAKHNLPNDSVEFVSADPGVYLSLLLSGQVDLQSASSDGTFPALQKAAAQSGKEVYFKSFSDWGYSAFGYLLVAANDSLANDPDDASRFAKATAKAVEYSIDNPEDATKIMVKDNPTMNYDITLAQWKQSVIAMKTDYMAKHGYGAATQDRIESTIDMVKQALHITAEIAPGDFYATASK